MKLRKINTEQEKEIILLYNENSLMRIGKIYNVSWATIRNCLIKNGVKLKNKKIYSFTSEQENQIITLYNNKINVNYIAERFNVSQSTIFNMLKKFNIKRKKNDTKYTLDEHFFDNVNTKEKAYILGLLYADGCNTGNEIELSLIEPDKDLLLKIRNSFKSNRPLRFIKPRKSTHQNMYSLSFSSIKLCVQASRIGLVKSKTLTIKFPEFLKEKNYSSFIRGYFDGDGCIYFNKNRRNLSFSFVGTKSMCESIKKIFEEKLDIHCGIYNQNNKKIKILTISGNSQVIKTMEYLYKGAAIFMKRKRKKYSEALKNLNKNPKKTKNQYK